MAVPKKRTGHSAQGHRRSCWKAAKPELTRCSNCGAAVLTHTVCTSCGTYKGKPVSIKDRKDESSVKKETKSIKKSSELNENVEKVEGTNAETAKAENAEAEGNVKTEEVKAETENTQEEVSEDKAE